MKTSIAAIAIALTFTGCATTPGTYAPQAGQTQSDADLALAQCDYEAAKAVNGKPGLIRRPILVEQCMGVAGYR